MHANRRRIQQRDISIQYMYISIRIQGLFRNVPPPLIPGFAISHLQDSFWDECHILWHSMHWFWETMVPGWVIGKHILCSWHKCTCLRPQHPLGYAQLLEGKAAILLMVVFTGGSSSGPLNSSTGDSIGDKAEAACVYPGLILCPSTFQSPNRKNQSPVLEYPFPTSYTLDLWESKSYLKVFVKEILYQILWVTNINSEGVFYAVLGPALLSVKEEVNSLPAIASHWAKNSNLPQPTTFSNKEAAVASVQFSCSVVSNSLWPCGSWAIFLLPLSVKQLWK